MAIFGQKWVIFAIAGLRHFLPHSDIFGIFFLYYGFFWQPLVSNFGLMDDLLGGVWAQKPVKTRGFLRFLERFY